MLNKIIRKIFKLFPYYRPAEPNWSKYRSGDSYRKTADHILDELEDFNSEDVQEDDYIFVKTDYLEKFFARDIKVPYTLITHNSDRNITEKELGLIPDNLTYWFAQNVTVKHDKLFPIPIGLENLHYYNHGIISNFTRLKPVKKNGRILFGFSDTNPKRAKIREALMKNPLADYVTGLSPKKYLELLNQYSYVASPEGNGIDCHRTWEALAVGTIPLVERSVMTEYFSKSYPMVIVDDWDNIKIEH